MVKVTLMKMYVHVVGEVTDIVVHSEELICGVFGRSTNILDIVFE